MARLDDALDFIHANKGPLVLYVFLVYIVISAIQSIVIWYRLRHFKGPFWAGFTKWWLVRHVVGTGTWHLDSYEVCKKYGRVARIGPEQLITSDPDIVRRYLGVRSPYKRSDWYMCTRFDPARDNVESERNCERHAWLRSKMSAGYSGKENEGLEQTIDHSIMAFVNMIDSRYISTDAEYRPMDFARKVPYFTLDTITALAHGKPFGCLTSDSDVHDYNRTIETMIPFAMMISIYPWINWVLQWRIAKLILPSEADPIGVGKIKSITKQLVAERFGPDKKVIRDMMGSFVRHGLSQEEVESETIVQLLAGTDTTSSIIRSTFLYIITNPRVLRRLRAEMASMLPPPPPSSSQDSTPPITYAQALSLPYLQATIKEGLRIYPSVVALLSKQVPEGGDFLYGNYVPAGTRIGWCLWGMFRDEAVFGPDVDAFRPERWLGGDGKDEAGWKMNLKAAEDTLSLVFSYGKHSCLGKNVALIELNKVFIELIRRFEFAIVDPFKAWDCRSVGVFHQKNMWVRVTRREVEETAL